MPHVTALTMREFEAAVARNPWLILPVGATEEHGPHLPVGTDTLQAERIAAAVAERTGALVAAPIPYGLCRTTRRFPGTVSISYETVERLALEVLQGFAAHGLRRFLVFSGHAGEAHMVALRQAALRLVEGDGGLTILTCCTSDFLRPILAEHGIARDGHAGAAETSLMLTLEPGAVRGEPPQASRPDFPPFQALPHPERLFPSGLMGDASRASAALGERLFAFVVDRLVELLARAEAAG
ncbi:MAG: creatininase family protein [candidate division NC10 bacterium]|nr:creatininase family protein [candidate division NC10 bacterium]